MPINENRNFSEEIVSLVRGKYSPAILREKSKIITKTALQMRSH